MNKNLFKNADEETQAVVFGAAIALHALVAGRAGAVVDSAVIGEAFAISREFWKQAKLEGGE